MIGAGGGSRTRTLFRGTNFKSVGKHHAVRLFRKLQTPFSWAKLIDAAKLRLADAAVEAGKAKGLLTALYELSATEKTAADAISTLSTQGNIFDLLYKFSSPEDVQGEALCSLSVLQHVPSCSSTNPSDGVKVSSSITGN